MSGFFTDTRFLNGLSDPDMIKNPATTDVVTGFLDNNTIFDTSCIGLQGAIA